MFLCRLQLCGNLNYVLIECRNIFPTVRNCHLLGRKFSCCNSQSSSITKTQSGNMHINLTQTKLTGVEAGMVPLLDEKRTFTTANRRKGVTVFTLASVAANNLTQTPVHGCRSAQFHSCPSLNQKKSREEKNIILKERAFREIEDKNKDTFISAVSIFEKQSGHRRGHVEFIYAAMKYMEDFGVHRDLESYKKLMDIFPKGRMIPTNMFQQEFFHFPHQQQCALDLLDKMEGYGVLPDMEMGDILKATFGKWGFPTRKYMRMMYWMPKFKHLSPFPLPEKLPLDAIELAKLAIARICGVDLESQVSIFRAKDLVDSVDDTWIVSGQSPKQQELLQKLPSKTPVYVEGVFAVYLRHHQINYFILRADIKPPDIVFEDLDDVSQIPLFMFGEAPPTAIAVIPSVHEQEDGTILSICATGSSSRDSVLSWVRFLQEANPRLKELPIIFTLRSPAIGLVPTDDSAQNDEQKLPKHIGNFQFVDVTDDKK